MTAHTINKRSFLYILLILLLINLKSVLSWMGPTHRLISSLRRGSMPYLNQVVSPKGQIQMILDHPVSILPRQFSRMTQNSVPKWETFKQKSLGPRDKINTQFNMFLRNQYEELVKDMEAEPVTRTILKYPHPQLRQDNEDVTVFDDDLQKLCKELLILMYQFDGVGLAAPQVGVNKRIMVFNENGRNSTDKEIILINPKIISSSSVTDIKEEGCLSFPMIEGRVQRSVEIEVSYLDVNGQSHQKQFSGFPARIFQHEYDHLDKVLFIDRFHFDDKKKNEKRLGKMIKRFGPEGIP